MPTRMSQNSLSSSQAMESSAASIQLGHGHSEAVQVMGVGSLGEISTRDNVRSPVTEVSQALVKELAPVSRCTALMTWPQTVSACPS